MIITIAPMVNPENWELPYLLKTLDFLKEDLDDNYHFIIARMNNPTEIAQYKATLKSDKKNILIMLSDEAGIKPYFQDQLFLTFRTYNRKGVYDNVNIFPIPCGFCGKHNDFLYEDMEKEKQPLIDRKYDIFYSGQISPNRMTFVDKLRSIKDEFNSVIQVTKGFAQGFSLGEYYNYMSNSKICLVPNGAVIPESFRYFEAFENNCIVITSYPKNSDIYNNWYYDKSPAIFIDNWGELTKDMIQELLTPEKLNEYNVKNKEYFDKYLSSNSVSNYILEKINLKNEKYPN